MKNFVCCVLPYFVICRQVKRAFSREVDGKLCIAVHARIWLFVVGIYIHTP